MVLRTAGGCRASAVRVRWGELCGRGSPREVEYFVVVVWVDGMAFLDPPAILCRAWHPDEEGEPEESGVSCCCGSTTVGW